MGVNVNEIVQVTHQGVFENNKYMLVTNWKVTATDSVDSVVSDLNHIITHFKTVAAGTFMSDMLNILPGNYNVHKIRAQVVRPSRSLYMEDTVNLAGLHTTDADTGNLATAITRVSNAAGRKGISTLHLGPLPRGAVSLGGIDPTYLALVELFAQTSIEDQTTAAPAITLRPVILHPVGATIASSEIVTYRLGDTVRTMRRRTLGLGI